MKQIIKISLLVCLYNIALSSSNAAEIGVNSSTISLTSSCPEPVKLLKNTPIEQLYGSMNSSKTKLYLSANYCFVYYKPEPELKNRYLSTRFHEVDEKYKISTIQGRNIANSYRKAYSWLSSRQQKLYFIHFFLSKLTRVSLVTPYAVEEKSTEIYITADITPDYHRFILLDVAKNMGTLETLHQLNQLQNNPPKAQDYPALSKLVDAVIDGKEVVSDDKLYKLTAGL